MMAGELNYLSIWSPSRVALLDWFKNRMPPSLPGELSKSIATAAIALAGYVADLSAQQVTPPNNLFTAAGFEVRYADTPVKFAHLKRFPPDKLVTRTRNGKTYYIYADPNICRCAYVGTLAAYRAFQSGGAGPQAGFGGESAVQELTDETTEDDTPAVEGAPSFNDYVFGGLRDD